MQKALVWLANFDLSCMELRCRKPAALVGSSHEHRHVRGGMHVECVGHRNVASYTGKYTAELGAVYAKAVRAFVCSTTRSNRVSTRLRTLADRSPVARGAAPVEQVECRKVISAPQYLLHSNDVCFEHIAARLY